MTLKPSQFNIPFFLDNRYIVFNTYSGSIAAFKMPFNEWLNFASEQERESLKQNGFLVSAELDEIGRIILERNQTIFNPFPKQLFFEISTTMKCQAHCLYCFESTLEERVSLTEENAQAAVNMICKELDRTGAKKLTVAFFGGEPLLASQCLLWIGDRLSGCCKDRNVDFESRLTTNGILFTRSLAEECVRRAHLKRVQITLDGMGDDYKRIKGVDAFQTVVDNISSTCNLVDLVVRLNVSQDNITGIREVIHYLTQRCKLDDKITIYLAQVENVAGCTSGEGVYASNAYFNSAKTQLYREFLGSCNAVKANHLLPKPRRNFCDLECSGFYSIHANGGLYKCSRLLGDTTKCVGHVTKGSSYSVQEIDFYRPLDEKCVQNRCSLLPICFGGCPKERVLQRSFVDCAKKRQQLCEDLSIVVQNMAKN